MRQDAENLASEVRRRLAQLRLTPRQLETRGGPSGKLVADLLNGDYKNRIGPTTAGKFDEALEWEPGSGERCLYGEAPSPLERAVRPHDSFTPDELMALAFLKNLLPQLEQQLSSIPEGTETRRATEIAANVARRSIKGLESPQTGGLALQGGRTMLAFIDAVQDSLPDLGPDPNVAARNLRSKFSL